MINKKLKVIPAAVALVNVVAVGGTSTSIILILILFQLLLNLYTSRMDAIVLYYAERMFKAD